MVALKFLAIKRQKSWQKSFSSPIECWWRGRFRAQPAPSGAVVVRVRKVKKMGDHVKIVKIHDLRDGPFLGRCRTINACAKTPGRQLCLLKVLIYASADVQKASRRQEEGRRRARKGRLQTALFVHFAAPRRRNRESYTTAQRTIQPHSHSQTPRRCPCSGVLRRGM